MSQINGLEFVFNKFEFDRKITRLSAQVLQGQDVSLSSLLTGEVAAVYNRLHMDSVFVRLGQRAAIESFVSQTAAITAACIGSAHITSYDPSFCLFSAIALVPIACATYLDCDRDFGPLRLGNREKSVIDKVGLIQREYTPHPLEISFYNNEQKYVMLEERRFEKNNQMTVTELYRLQLEGNNLELECQNGVPSAIRFGKEQLASFARGEERKIMFPLPVVATSQDIAFYQEKVKEYVRLLT